MFFPKPFRWLVSQGDSPPVWEFGDGGFPIMSTMALEIEDGKPLVRIREINVDDLSPSGDVGQ